MDDSHSSNEKFPDCMQFYDQFSYCLKPSTQFNHIYKHGAAMDCNEYLSDWKKCLFVKLLKDQDRINVSDSCYMVEYDPLEQCSPLLDDLTPSSLHLPYLYRKCIDHPTCAATRAPTGTTSSSTRILHPGITTTSSWAKS
jgi:hypothetical protein